MKFKKKKKRKVRQRRQHIFQKLRATNEIYIFPTDVQMYYCNINSILHFPHSLYISKISNMKVKFCSCSPSTLSIVVQSISMCVSHCKC